MEECRNSREPIRENLSVIIVVKLAIWPDNVPNLDRQGGIR